MKPEIRKTEIGGKKIETTLWTGRRCLRFGIYVKARLLEPLLNMVSSFKEANMKEGQELGGATAVDLIKAITIPETMSAQLTALFDSLDNDEFDRFLFGPEGSSQCAGGLLELTTIDGAAVVPDGPDSNITDYWQFMRIVFWVVQVNYAPFSVNILASLTNLSDGLVEKAKEMGINMENPNG